jgi:hypothetical protein
MNISWLYSITLAFLSACNPLNQDKVTLDDGLKDDSSNATQEDSEEDLLRAFYLLEQSGEGENLLWKLDINTKETTLLGDLECPFAVFNDKLAAMTADPKGTLWALSEAYEIMRIIPGTLSCTAFPILASSPDFQGESLAFIETEEGTEFFLAGYYSNPQGASSTALARMTTTGISIIAPITNLEGQDIVIDIDTTPNQRLYGYRGWGNLSEFFSLSPQTGAIEESQTIYIDTAQNFALLSDNQSHWFFTNTAPEGSQLHRLKGDEWEWWLDLPFVVVGASGIQ